MNYIYLNIALILCLDIVDEQKDIWDAETGK